MIAICYLSQMLLFGVLFYKIAKIDRYKGETVFERIGEKFVFILTKKQKKTYEILLSGMIGVPFIINIILPGIGMWRVLLAILCNFLIGFRMYIYSTQFTDMEIKLGEYPPKGKTL